MGDRVSLVDPLVCKSGMLQRICYHAKLQILSNLVYFIRSLDPSKFWTTYPRVTHALKVTKFFQQHVPRNTLGILQRIFTLESLIVLMKRQNLVVFLCGVR